MRCLIECPWQPEAYLQIVGLQSPEKDAMSAGLPSIAGTCLIARQACLGRGHEQQLFNHLLLPFCMCDGAMTMSVCKLPGH